MQCHTKQRKENMAKQTAKKTTAKKTVAKKTAPKAAAKKTIKKTTVVETPVVEKHVCGCDKNCACGGNCHCAHHKHGFFKKLILFLVIFALGFATAKMCCGGKKAFGPRPEFDNGCLVIKCPKMAQMAPMMDANHDGCIAKDEFRSFRKGMKNHKRPHVAE